MRRMSLAAALLAVWALLPALPALAQSFDLDELKASGAVGEQADGYLGGGHHHHKDSENLPGQQQRHDIGGEGHHSDVHRIEHQLNAHQYYHGVTLGQRPEEPDTEQDRREYQIMFQPDSHPISPSR